QDGLPLVGRLAALLTIPPADQLALEAALGTRLGTLVLADEPALWKLVERQQDQQALLAIALENGFRPEPPPLPKLEDSRWALEVVQVDERIASLAPLLLGHVLLVPDHQQAYRLAQRLPAGGVAVAPDGFMVHAGGLVEFNRGRPQQS